MVYVVIELASARESALFLYVRFTCCKIESCAPAKPACPLSDDDNAASGRIKCVGRLINLYGRHFIYCTVM